MKKSTITIILLSLVIVVLITSLFIIKAQRDNYKSLHNEDIQKNSKLINEKEDTISCFSSQISSTETCLSNCHTLTCYQGCHINNNDILNKCSNSNNEN